MMFYVPAAILQERVTIMGSSKMISEGNILRRCGFLPKGMSQKFCFIPFDEGTKKVGIGAVLSKSSGGSKFEYWKVEIESINLEAGEFYTPGSIVQVCSLHMGQVIEVPIPLIYISINEQKLGSEEAACNNTTPLQEMSSRNLVMECSKDTYGVQLEEHNTPNGSFSRTYPTNLSPEFALGPLRQVAQVFSMSSSAMKLSGPSPKEDTRFANVIDKMAKHSLQHDEESDVDTFAMDNEDTATIKTQAKKQKVACLNDLVVLKDISNKQPSNANAVKFITSGAAFTMANNNTYLFKMFAAEDRLDGDSYPLWAYMMEHVLVSKDVLNIVQGNDVCLGSVDVDEVEDAAGLATRIAAARVVLPIAEQARWDVKDAQAHALIALSVKRTITPHTFIQQIYQTGLGYLCRSQ
ncbi:hypothetical protein L7F22_045326 [Adiantum nelumboides]|nr:hypothetical protein [Adiantum nelumboides]